MNARRRRDATPRAADDSAPRLHRRLSMPMMSREDDGRAMMMRHCRRRICVDDAGQNARWQARDPRVAHPGRLCPLK